MTNKLLAGAIICTCFVGTLSMAQNDGAKGQNDQAPSDAAKLQSLREKRLQICQSYKEAVDAMYAAGGHITVEHREEAANELFEARVEMSSGPDLVVIYRNEIERLSQVEKRMQDHYQSPRELLMAELRRLKLEIELAKMETGGN